jgi:anti-sigma factor RsiW
MSRDEHQDPVERALDEALRHVPRHPPSAAFERRLRERLEAAPSRPPAAAAPAPRRPLATWLLGLAAVAALGAIVAVATSRRTPSVPPGDGWSLTDEAVSDHLRVVASTRPPEIESGGIHQVKPWFTGRVDFAPRVAFGGDADFPLVGGSLGYVRDRKAAVLQFRRRLHAITLLVFPTAGLAWPDGGVSLGGRLVHESTSRGFSVLLWRDADLGYALVSDVARPELEMLVPRITP